ncbi:hypothetical protein [Spirochaeta isovalerica]|uniref:Uncharacterized protein n=1 Tax=Spirochaeta isovalerica TaxID=150 RepID=A0A841RDS4_9SPIO|nr:hypothetical protein [Spirochaeta isovalerica]MBB6480522.1 hypothetical protein [Spirochaeta isovalerica]
MKKVILLFLLAVMALSMAAAEAPVLFIYEESNENIDPWLEMLRSGLASRSIAYEEKSAAELEGLDLSPYSSLFLYGAVMAFTFKEPIRDWLDTEPDLSEKKVSLLVTANRWFLDKYRGQLQQRLDKHGAETIDTISSATKNLSDDEKAALALKALSAIP